MSINRQQKEFKIITSLFIGFLFFSIPLFSQRNNLGFRDYIEVNYTNAQFERTSFDPTTKASSEFTNKLHNINFKGGGAVIFRNLFDEEDDFYIGDYWDLGFGVGKGTRSGKELYAGTNFDIYFMFNIGVAAQYSITEDIQVGLKVYAIGFDAYFDFTNDSPIFSNNFTFMPSVRYTDFQFSIGYGKGNEKISDNFIAEGKYHFSDRFSALARFQKGNVRYESASIYKAHTSAFSFGFGITL